MKILLIILGFISLVLGILGIFLPVLPTTPFLLLTAWCWLRSSDKLYIKLMNHRKLGPYISDFINEKSIPLRTKIWSITLLWITILLSIVFAVENIYIRILLFVIAIGVTIHILSFNTKKK